MNDSCSQLQRIDPPGIPFIVDNPAKGPRQVQVSAIEAPNTEEGRMGIYTEAQILLVCVDVTSKRQQEGIMDRWDVELNGMTDLNQLRVLVGTKTDLRDHEDRESRARILNENRDGEEDEVEYLTAEQGKQLAKQMGAFAYVECSALSGDGLEEAWKTTAAAWLHEIDDLNKPLAHWCQIL